jgi:hypothetical protein
MSGRVLPLGNLASDSVQHAAYGEFMSSSPHQKSAVEPTSSARKLGEGQYREFGRITGLSVQFENEAVASEAVSTSQHQMFVLDFFGQLEARLRLCAEKSPKHGVIRMRH